MREGRFAYGAERLGHVNGLSRLSILLVEDDALIALGLTETMTEMGHCVCSVETSGLGAVLAAARYRPELMIVDVNLTDGSGVAAVNEVLTTGFIPHIFMTGDTYIAKALEQRSVVLQKPFHERELAAGIERALANRPQPSPATAG